MFGGEFGAWSGTLRFMDVDTARVCRLADVICHIVSVADVMHAGERPDLV